MSPGTRVTPGFSNGRPNARFQAALGMSSPAQTLEELQRQSANTTMNIDDRFKVHSFLQIIAYQTELRGNIWAGDQRNQFSVPPRQGERMNHPSRDPEF
jgi:hypothetical protein